MANQEISINLGIPQIPDIKDPALFNELFRVYNAIRAIASTTDAYTGALVPPEDEWSEIPFQSSYRVQNISRMFVPASEAISGGAMVNLWNDSGTLKARPASAATGRITQAWNARATAAGDLCLLTFPNSIYSNISGLTPAAFYWTAATPGFISATAPTTPGHIIQPVGYALNENELFFCPAITTSVVPSPPPPPPDLGG